MEGNLYTMANIVKVTYDADKLNTTISLNEREFDTSRIKERKIEEWIYPFLIKGVRWKGFFQEIKEFNDGSDSFTVKFDGNEKYFKLLEKSLEGSNARIVSSDNNVVILYRKDPLSTIITVNGKAFDTSRLADRKIDEWVLPFEIAEIKWSGIFSELDEFIGTNDYSIQFSGEADDMLELVNNAPDTVDIMLKMPAAASAGSQLHKATAAASNAIYDVIGNIKENEQYQKLTENENVQKAAAAANAAAEKLDRSLSSAADNIKNSQQYQKIMENEKVQKVAENKVIKKISEFWKGLHKGVKYGICCILVVAVIGTAAGLAFGSGGGEYKDLVIDCVMDSMDEECDDINRNNMPANTILKSYVILVSDKAEKYQESGKIKVKNIDVHTLPNTDISALSTPALMEDHLFKMYEIVDEEIGEYLEFTCTMVADGQKFPVKGHIIVPHSAFENEWRAFVTDISIGEF